MQSPKSGKAPKEEEVPEEEVEAVAPPDTITTDELEDVIADKRCKALYSSCRLGPRDLRAVFHKMDPFARGEVRTVEFLRGCTRMLSDVEGIDVVVVKGAGRRQAVDLLELKCELDVLIEAFSREIAKLRGMPVQAMTASTLSSYNSETSHVAEETSYYIARKVKRIQNENDRLRSKLKVQAGQLKARQHSSTREVIKALQGFVPPSRNVTPRRQDHDEINEWRPQKVDDHEPEPSLQDIIGVEPASPTSLITGAGAVVGGGAEMVTGLLGGLANAWGAEPESPSPPAQPAPSPPSARPASVPPLRIPGVEPAPEPTPPILVEEVDLVLGPPESTAQQLARVVPGAHPELDIIIDENGDYEI